MAVNIDTVYQRVLAIANKEQRGYITPQEYNLFANQAQMSIFEQYFYDINQFDRLPGSEHPYSDMTTLLEEKISIFKKRNQPVTITNQYGDGVLPTDMYRLGTVLRFSLSNVTGSTAAEIEEVSDEEYMYYNASPLAAPSKYRPIYIRNSATTIKIYPHATTINTGLNKSAFMYFEQSGTSKYNGQDNQFSVDGFTDTVNSGQGSISTTVFLTPSSLKPIKVGQTVTGTNIINSPATLVSSIQTGTDTTIATTFNAGVKIFVVANATNIQIGQLVNASGSVFPANTFVVGVQGVNITVNNSSINPGNSGSTVNFHTKLVLSQNPSDLITNNTVLTFNENNLNYIEVGQTAISGALPEKTTVTAVSATAVTMSNDFNNAGFRTVIFSSDDIKCHYIRRPADVVWGYNTVNSTALYNSSTSTNFELHESEETQLVIKVLALAGISMKDQSIYQIATAEENRTIQQEKL